MKASVFSTLLLASSAIAGRSPQHVNKKLPERIRREPAGLPAVGLDKRAATKKKHHIIPQNKNTTKYAVDGTKIPDVNFDIGESYAGLMPISSQQNASELYFWFFPSEDSHASDEILIWLNGGPGCSSLEGLLQENSIISWNYGTYAPVKNNYAWSNLTNTIWIEQPAGTGFSSKGSTPPATSEEEVAEQFAGFWKNFIETFGLQHKKVYITGESYAGFYVPYIADNFIRKNDSALYDVHGIMINDPSISYDVVLQDIPATPFVDYWGGLFNLNQTFMDDIHNRSEACGYTAFMEEALTFPPKGLLPAPPNADYSMPGCELWNDIFSAVSLVNPCFDIYQIATTCPVLWDVLGFPGSFDYLPQGAEIYFNRTDVQKAINAPIQEWEECTSGILRTDTSEYTSLSVLPKVIEHTNNVIIGQGMLDYIVSYNGTLMAIQNMTYNGAQGFSQAPETWDDFFVPYHSELNQGNLAGSGAMGKYHTERGLTFVTVQLAGHMIPQYSGSSSYRILEKLLGRVKTLGTETNFSTQKGNFGNGFDFVTANVTK
ncbi:alpha/beta-hydrolase [Aureobasidium sp. EXF-10728]|nr:alpha/beta-hydrolase [Aureobasidium sp. EXF-10728]